MFFLKSVVICTFLLCHVINAHKGTGDHDHTEQLPYYFDKHEVVPDVIDAPPPIEIKVGNRAFI